MSRIPYTVDSVSTRGPCGLQAVSVARAVSVCGESGLHRGAPGTGTETGTTPTDRAAILAATAIGLPPLPWPGSSVRQPSKAVVPWFSTTARASSLPFAPTVSSLAMVTFGTASIQADRVRPA